MELKELEKEIAASIYISPCSEDELHKRDFLKNKSNYGVLILIQSLENDGAIFYRSGKMYIRKEWAKKNLAEYDLDFETPKEKWYNSLSPLAKDLYKQGLITYK